VSSKNSSKVGDGYQADVYLAHRQAVPAPPPSRPAINLSFDKILVHGYHMDNVKNTLSK
jgi:hypothetical protein